ncbi:MAG: peptide chain release factor 1, partial [Bacteroidia bacterium]
MKASIAVKLDNLLERFEDLSALLSASEIIADQDKFRAYSKEYAELEPVVMCHRNYKQVEGDMAEARVMLGESDADMRAMAEEELSDSSKKLVV